MKHSHVEVAKNRDSLLKITHVRMQSESLPNDSTSTFTMSSHRTELLSELCTLCMYGPENPAIAQSYCQSYACTYVHTCICTEDCIIRALENHR